MKIACKFFIHATKHYTVKFFHHLSHCSLVCMCSHCAFVEETMHWRYACIVCMVLLYVHIPVELGRQIQAKLVLRGGKNTLTVTKCLNIFFLINKTNIFHDATDYMVYFSNCLIFKDSLWSGELYFMVFFKIIILFLSIISLFFIFILWFLLIFCFFLSFFFFILHLSCVFIYSFTLLLCFFLSC